MREPAWVGAARLGHVGNAALARTLAPARPPERRLSRFEPAEHKQMGDAGTAGTTMQLGELTVSFGDMTAMAGDYFGSVEEMQALASTPGSVAPPFHMPGTVDEIKYVLYVEVQKTMSADQFHPAVINATKQRSYALTKVNAPHFTQPEEGDAGLGHEELASKGPVNNAGSYRGNHEQAIERAVAAGAVGSGPLDDALLFEGFASHFLTDAYAAGHLRTPRTAISDWWDPKVPMFWHNLKLWLAESIARHINENSLSGPVITVNYYFEQSIIQIEDAMAAKGIPELSFGDALSGALHDLDNVKGVEARVGDQVVTLVGDGQVLDEHQRELVRGVETAKLAAAGVRASMRDVDEAYEHAVAGMTDPAEVMQALKTPDGLYRSEQLWPRALPEDQQANAALPWKVATIDELFADPGIQEALTHFAHEKADTLGSEVELAQPLKADKEAAMRATLAKLKQDRSVVVGLLREIINYTPGLVTAGSPGREGDLTGLFGDMSDDQARAYYDEAKKRGALHTLTVPQRERLIRLALDGPTLDEDEGMIVGLLASADAAAIATVLDTVGWRNVWENLHGAEAGTYVDAAGQAYWSKQPYSRKRDEVGYLADGLTGDVSQKAMIAILRTCTPDEVAQIDDEVGGLAGLSWDLTGVYQEEFNRLKGAAAPVPAP